MFGYIKTDLPNVYMKDVVLYKSLYCGLCKALGKTCGQKSRFLLSYDLTFLSLFVHNICNQDIKISQEKCVIHWFRKRPVAKVDPLTMRVSALNVILAYHKMNDDVYDSKKGRLKRALFKRSYKKAVKAEPVLDQIVKARYNVLVSYEKANVDSVDMASDPFGNLILDVIKELCGDNFNKDVEQIGYNLGKWIYLIDALDDFDKDVKNKNFNVFVNCFNDVKDKKSLLIAHLEDVEQIFSDVLFSISSASKNVDYKFNSDLILNILNLGLKQQTKFIMENKKCKNTTKF